MRGNNFNSITDVLWILPQCYQKVYHYRYNHTVCLAPDQCLDLVLISPSFKLLTVLTVSQNTLKSSLQCESQTGWELILTAVAASWCWWSSMDREENFPPPAGADLMTCFKGIRVRITYLINISPATLKKPQKELVHTSGVSTKIASVCKPIQIKN